MSHVSHYQICQKNCQKINLTFHINIMICRQCKIQILYFSLQEFLPGPPRVKKNYTFRTEMIDFNGDDEFTHSVTPDDQMSTLNPQKSSSPFAISGGWKAGDPWLVLQVSWTRNGSSS